jgi:hypothetical protein
MDESVSAFNRFALVWQIDMDPLDGVAQLRFNGLDYWPNAISTHRH